MFLIVPFDQNLIMSHGHEFLISIIMTDITVTIRDGLSQTWYHDIKLPRYKAEEMGKNAKIIFKKTKLIP